MSVEYEVRSDDDYSRPASASEARSILVERWGVRDLGGGMLLYERDECYVEVYGRLRGLGIFERPALTLSIVVVITVLLAAADIVLDVLGEIHTDADARAGRISGK